MYLESTHLHWLFKETVRRLETLQSRVREGTQLQEAAEFARYIYWSKIPELLSSCPQPEPFRIDGHLVREMAQKLLSDVQEQWRTNPRGYKPDSSAFEQILAKLEAIEAKVTECDKCHASVLQVSQFDKDMKPLHIVPKGGEAA
jgi:hypothetical protein